jgi:[acyl-carrier-protein] S-malonyltransferase
MLLCPGQGGQHAGMYDLARTHAGARALLARMAPPPVDGTDLHANAVAQPAIVAATLAMWEALREHAPAPALVAGYSIGELAAYGVAGALDPVDAVALAARRAALMDEAAQAGPRQALAALGGLPLAQIRALTKAAGMHVAIVTGEDSAIVGGLAQSLPAFEATVLERGGRMQVLPVGVASHTPLMAQAVAPFAASLDTASFHAQRCLVLSGISAARCSGKAMAVAQLSRQLAEPIQWSACMDAAVEAGITVALELGPGAALSRMLQVRHPGVACRSVSEFRSLDGIAAWLARSS